MALQKTGPWLGGAPIGVEDHGAHAAQVAQLGGGGEMQGLRVHIAIGVDHIYKVAAVLIQDKQVGQLGHHEESLEKSCVGGGEELCRFQSYTIDKTVAS